MISPACLHSLSGPPFNSRSCHLGWARGCDRFYRVVPSPPGPAAVAAQSPLEFAIDANAAVQARRTDLRTEPDLSEQILSAMRTCGRYTEREIAQAEADLR